VEPINSRYYAEAKRRHAELSRASEEARKKAAQTSTPSSAGKAVEQAANNVEPVSKQYNAMLLLIPCHSHIEDRY